MSKRKPTGKRYSIDSFDKLCNLMNKDNFDSISIDMMHWMWFNVNWMDKFRKEYPKLAKGKTNQEIAKTSFIWIDDGKEGLTEIKSENILNGEIKTYKIKP